MTHVDSTATSSKAEGSANSDRRHQRSNDPLVALHYQLEHARREGKVDAMVVADDSGVMVAGAGPWASCEELAAYAPLLARGVWCEPALEPALAANGPLAKLRTEVDVQRVDSDGHTVLLCGRGGWMRAKAMETAAQGVARILTSR
jgi:hypothetical protein